MHSIERKQFRASNPQHSTLQHKEAPALVVAPPQQYSTLATLLIQVLMLVGSHAATAVLHRKRRATAVGDTEDVKHINQCVTTPSIRQCVKLTRCPPNKQTEQSMIQLPQASVLLASPSIDNLVRSGQNQCNSAGRGTRAVGSQLNATTDQETRGAEQPRSQPAGHARPFTVGCAATEELGLQKCARTGEAEAIPAGCGCRSAAWWRVGAASATLLDSVLHIQPTCEHRA
jgi:hypothetical protein